MADDESALARRRRRRATDPAANPSMATSDDPVAAARKAKRNEEQRLREQAEEMRKSVNKAATARAHKRPPPLVRKGTAKASGLEMLSSFMGLSVEILHLQLHATMPGDDDQPDHAARRSAARYVMDKIAAAEGTYIPGDLEIFIDSEDVITTGNRIIELVVGGQMSIEAGGKVFGLLQQQAQLHGLNELDQLKEMIARMSGDQAKVVNGIPGGHQSPAWMRLVAAAPKGS